MNDLDEMGGVLLALEAAVALGLVLFLVWFSLPKNHKKKEPPQE